jgi:ubiquinone/menaquinone biosynthesis C-methylase UbiE
MSEGPNAGQIAYWNDAPGHTWAELQALLDRQLRPLGRAAMAALAPQPGERILDIGCGAGETTTELAAAVAPEGSAVGADISRPMLEAARRRAPQLSFLEADAQTYPFEAGAFDAAFSRFGVMFFADPAPSFANLRKALRKGGRLTFVCWQEPKLNAWLIEPMRAVYRHVPKLPQLGPEDPGPFSFASPERVKRILGQAGFADVSMEPHSLKLDISAGEGIDAAVGSAAEIGPANLALEGQPDAVRTAAVASIRESLLAHVKDNGIWLDAAVWIVAATAP